MGMNKKVGIAAIALAGYAYYRWSKLTPEEKQNLIAKIKSFGEGILDYLPKDIRDVVESALGSNKTTNSGSQSSSSSNSNTSNGETLIPIQ